MLPRWLVYKKCLAGGRRLAKKPIFVPPVSAFDRRMPPIVHAAKVLANWDNWEYRFWAADINEGNCVVAECRACGSMFGGSEGRGIHLAKMGCAKRLVAAFKLLLKDRRCVICNERTGLDKWGVPLCSAICIETWSHSESQPPPLTAALQIVGNG
jgi:hypothetical protein